MKKALNLRMAAIVRAEMSSEICGCTGNADGRHL